MPLTFDHLLEANISRCYRWHPGGPKDWSLSDWGVAAAGEMGEALNVIKKLNRERDGIVGNSVDAETLRQQLADELADVVIYLDLLALRENIILTDAVAAKFNRTSEKQSFPERLGN